MQRREFILALGSAAVAWPFAARAQQLGKLPTIGFLGAGTPSAWSQLTSAFVQRLRELGWIEGRTVSIEYRWAEERSERYTEIAAERHGGGILAVIRHLVLDLAASNPRDHNGALVGVGGALFAFGASGHS
jgi:hypothetical protein